MSYILIFNLILFILLIAEFNCNIESELRKYFYNITFNEKELYEHNSKQNIECDVENKEFYRYTDHNFNEPLVGQRIVEEGL